MSPDRGMYGIKKVEPEHLDHEIFAKQEQDGNKRPLMNFTRFYQKAVSRIPVQHKALVYVVDLPRNRGWQKFVWAIELTGTLEDGDPALIEHGLNPGEAPPGIKPEYTLHRPIRFLARIDPPKNAPTWKVVCGRAGVDWRPMATTAGHEYISREKYERLFKAIPWTWRADSDGPLPEIEIPVEQQPAELLGSLITEPDKLLERVRAVRDGSERDKEDVVKTFLVKLGHREEDIRFRKGRVDIQVSAPNGGVLAVVEVKRSLLDQRDQARRQAFDYAMMTGAPLVVLTDADEYEVYDRREGLTHESTYRGSFSLTNFRRGDGDVLKLLLVPR